MFTGIIEALGTIRSIYQEENNLSFVIESPISNALRPDQSVSHDGVCLTVTELNETWHKVTAILETLSRSTLGNKKPKDTLNLERSMKLGDRLDGHMVQGHVDTTAQCEKIVSEHGSWRYLFQLHDEKQPLIDKGSISVNGVSLTVVNPSSNSFEVAIIPYTYQHTNFQFIHPGDMVNIEFDVIGKYVSKILEPYLLITDH